MIKRWSSKVRMLLLSVFCFCLFAVPAFAVGTENTDVTGAFTQLKDDILATMAPIGVAVISIAALLLAWRYGRKIMSTVAK